MDSIRRINYAVDLTVMIEATSEVWVEVPEYIKEEDREDWAEEEALRMVRIGQVEWKIQDPEPEEVDVEQVVECDW